MYTHVPFSASEPYRSQVRGAWLWQQSYLVFMEYDVIAIFCGRERYTDDARPVECHPLLVRVPPSRLSNAPDGGHSSPPYPVELA